MKSNSFDPDDYELVINGEPVEGFEPTLEQQAAFCGPLHEHGFENIKRVAQKATWGGRLIAKGRLTERGEHVVTNAEKGLGEFHNRWDAALASMLDPLTAYKLADLCLRQHKMLKALLDDEYGNTLPPSQNDCWQQGFEDFRQCVHDDIEHLVREVEE